MVFIDKKLFCHYNNSINRYGAAEKAEVRKMSKLEDILKPKGISLGLCNDGINGGTLEWFEKSTGEFRSGFATEVEAYVSASSYLKDAAGEDLPELDDDGEPIIDAIPVETHRG
jgi:hypothetical protein